MLSISDNNQADVVETFNSTSRDLDHLLNIDNPYFEQILSQIHPTKLQLNMEIFPLYWSSLFGLGLVHNKWHSFIYNLW